MPLLSETEGEQIQEIIKIELEGLEETCPPAEQVQELGTGTQSRAQSYRNGDVTDVSIPKAKKVRTSGLSKILGEFHCTLTTPVQSQT